MSGFAVPQWGEIFLPDLSLAESFLRASIVYLSLIVLFRVILKRQAGSLGLPDVMLVVLVSECVSPSLAAESNSVPNGLAAVAALLFWDYALDRLAHRWPWLDRRLEPQPVVLVKDGKAVRENLEAEGITDEELAAQLRLNGVDDVAAVKLATMESAGNVSVVPKEDSSPAAPDSQTSTGERDLDRVTRQLLAAAAELRKAAERRAAKKARRPARRGARARKSAPPPNDPKE